MRSQFQIIITLLALIGFGAQSTGVSSATFRNVGNTHTLLGVTMQPLRHHPPNDPYEENRIIQMPKNAQQLGASVVGVDIHWNWIEDVSADVWNSVTTQRLESFLNQASQRNLKVLATVLGTPCWASSDPTKNCTASPAFIYSAAYPPIQAQDYANFVRKLVQRYKNQIQFWQIWNEPNETEFLIDPYASAYTALLQVTYPVIKAHAPDAIVVGGALSPRENNQAPNIDALVFMDNMYSAGAQGYFDAMAFHPYTDGFSPDYYDPGWPMHSFTHSIPAIRDRMRAHGDVSPIWITESGWTTVQNCSNCAWQPELPTTEAEQAIFLRRTIEILKTWDYVDAYMYYTLTDYRNPDPTKWEDHFGLFRSNLSAKSAAQVFRQAALPFRAFLPVVERPCESQFRRLSDIVH